MKITQNRTKTGAMDHLWYTKKFTKIEEAIQNTLQLTCTDNIRQNVNTNDAYC